MPHVQVTLSSLNRHCLATRADVGIPKATCLAQHFQGKQDPACRLLAGVQRGELVPGGRRACPGFSSSSDAAGGRAMRQARGAGSACALQKNKGAASSTAPPCNTCPRAAPPPHPPHRTPPPHLPADIVPEARVEPVVAMYTPEAEEQLLGGSPDFVLDAIDNIDTKVGGATLDPFLTS